jgi:hypothetical protein
MVEMRCALSFAFFLSETRGALVYEPQLRRIQAGARTRNPIKNHHQ